MKKTEKWVVFVNYIGFVVPDKQAVLKKIHGHVDPADKDLVREWLENDLRSPITDRMEALRPQWSEIRAYHCIED